jgi:RNase P protein component
VRRNRVRRQLRAAVTGRANELSPGSYLIGAGAGALGRSLTELDAHLGRALSGVSALTTPQPNARSPIHPNHRSECLSNYGVCV